MITRYIRKADLFLFIIFVLMITFSVPHTSYAELSGSDVVAVFSPEIPSPNEKVTIKLTSYAIDLNKALITWRVSGKTVLSQNGATSYSLTAGDSGSKISLEATILFNGSTLVKTFFIEPSTIDIIWEAIDSYTPPFYRGKALPSSEAIIKVVGIPDIRSGSTKLEADDLTFTWERNFSALPEFSGYAKNSFIFKTSYLNTVETINVKASALNSGITAKKLSTIRTTSPFILFYEYSPLSGTNYKSDLAQYYYLKKEEAVLIAEPYYFSPRNILSADLEYEWSINGTRIETPSQKNKLVIKKPSGITGNASLLLSIESKSRLFQSAKKNLIVNLQN